MPQIRTLPQPESETDQSGKRLYQCTNFECRNRLWYTRDGSQHSPKVVRAMQ